MKKVTKILILSLLIIITLSTIVILRQKTNNINTYEYKANSNPMISMMLQDIEGNYVESDDLSWPTEDYKFNASLSKCTNGSKLKYNELENTINVETAKTDKCYAYFDNKNFIKDLSGNGNNGKAINIARWDEDGITTSDDTKKGFVNCGFANYQFDLDFSFVLYVRINSSVAESIFGNFEGGGIALEYSEKGLLYRASPYVMYAPNKPIDINRWYVVTYVFNQGKMSIYVDGTLYSSDTSAINEKLYVSRAPLVLGGNSSPNGTIIDGYAMTSFKEFLFFDRALTEDEIAKDYASEINPTNKNDMLLWYKF